LTQHLKDEKYARSLLVVTIFPTIVMVMTTFKIYGIPHLSLILMGIWPIGQGLILFIKDFDDHNTLEKLSINLQKEVGNKTNDLKEEKDNISKLLDNMKEVIFIIDDQGIIQSDLVSNYSKNLFGQEIIGKSVYETLFASIPKNNTLFGEIQSMVTSRGKDLKEWNKQKEKLPHQVKIKNNHKVIDVSIRYGEILSDDKTKVKEIVLSLVDITENERLKELQFNEKKRNIVISELAPEKGRDLEKYKNNLSHFFTSARNLISEASRIASGKSVDNINKWDEQLIWTNVHKVKGGSSLFGLKGLSSRLHEEESKFLVFKRGEKKLSEDIVLEICESLLAIIEIISEYESTAELLFGINSDTEKSKETRYIEIKKLDVVDKNIKLLSEKVNLREMDNVNREWGNLFKSSIIDLLSDFESLVEDTSRELGKKTSYRVGGDDIHLTDQFMSKILDSASHLLRNSIDHGIELPKVRAKNGKSKKGTIEVTCLMLDSTFQIKIKDDGRGIDEELIAKRAIKKNLISKEDYNRLLDHEKIYLIFLKGLSSKDEATSISGRGIGMDIVKVNIESLGGKVKVETEKSKGTEFTILIPLGSKGVLN
jgi:two-component system chemotaxis sensor kinase CheA